MSTGNHTRAALRRKHYMQVVRHDPSMMQTLWPQVVVGLH